MEESKSIKQKQGRHRCFLFYVLCIVFLCSVSVQAETKQQGNKITGTVVDVNGETLIGANVLEKGTTNGTITDINGNFSLNVSSRSSVLQVSYIGYVTQELTLSAEQWEGGKPLKVTMAEDSETLEEVVVVGYGTQKKINLTGAVAQVKGEILANRSTPTVLQALQGQIAGVNITSANGGAPGSNATLNIRGFTGLGRMNPPLIVIDGIPGGDINNINMNDVENISVLKDAASSAIYGSNGPFGVVLITTKRGKAGQKPTITYENNLGFAQPINLPRLMNSVEVANFYNEASANSGRQPLINAEQMERIIDYQDGLISYETVKNPTPGSDGWLEGNGNNDWYDIWFKKAAFTQRHSIGISGSTKSSSYYIGLGYLDQEGIFKVGEDRYQRYNVRVNLSTDITKWLTFNIRSSYVHGAIQTIDEDPDHIWQGPRIHAIARLRSFDPFIYPNGTKNNRYTSFEQAGKVMNISDNAVLTGEFVLHPLKGWEITGNYTFDINNVKKSNHQKTVYQTTAQGKVVPIYGTPNAFSRSFAQAQHHSVNIFSSYEKQLGDHYFKVLAGFNQELYDDLSLSGGARELYSDNLPSIFLAYGATSVSDAASQLVSRGGFGRINYNYKEKYLIEFNGRYDGTSRFLEDVRYKFYPGVSAGWVPSREFFWEPIQDYVNTLKIRASYGQLGDQNIADRYQFYPALNTVQASATNYIFADGRDVYISQPPFVDPSLTWVTSSTLDFGIDLAVLSNRLEVSFDWFRRIMDDEIGPPEVKPAILGAKMPDTNSASVKNEGFEITIGWRDRIGEVQYGANVILSDQQSTILKYPNPNNMIYSWYRGKKQGEIWGYETVGLFQSDEEIANAPSQKGLVSNHWTPGDCRYADLNGNGVIDRGSNTLDDHGDLKIIGNTYARYAFGVNLNVAYKGFDFTAFIQGIGKRNTVSDPDNNTATYFWGNTGDENQSNGFKEQLDRWSPDNPGGYYPKYYWGAEMAKNKLVQTRYMQNAAYVRLKNMQLGYTFPAAWMDKIGIEKLRVFANVENLFTITKLIKTMDPEFSNTAGYMGTDGKAYPLQRTWAFGINLTF